MNKRLLLLVLGISVSVSAILAETSSYFAENTRWGFLVLNEAPHSACKKDLCILKGDTTIDSKTYQKIIYNEQRIVPIREDSKKIYARINDKDFLLYDFTLEVGDVMPHYDDLDGHIDEMKPELQVIKVDSITLLDGRRAKRIEYDNLMYDIEYVGRVQGILAPFVYPYQWTCGPEVMCCSLNGEPIYESGEGYCEIVNDFFGMFLHATKWYGVERYVNTYASEQPQFKGVTYFLKGDTTINDTTYHALWRDKGEYFAGLRQSADGQQVYIRRNKAICPLSEGGDKDWLLYNFDVKVNDTVYAYDHSYAGIDPVGQEDIQYRWIVKEVKIVDGRKHVVVNGGQTKHDVEWIEGIGTRYIFFENNVLDALMGTTSTWALCAVDDEDNTLYSFDTEVIGIRNNCPDWEIIDSAIDNISSSTSASAGKFLRDGRLFIKHNGKTYTITGQEVK